MERGARNGHAPSGARGPCGVEGGPGPGAGPGLSPGPGHDPRLALDPSPSPPRPGPTPDPHSGPSGIPDAGPGPAVPLVTRPFTPVQLRGLGEASGGLGLVLLCSPKTLKGGSEAGYRAGEGS